jgi:hypothetical protein
MPNIPTDAHRRALLTRAQTEQRSAFPPTCIPGPSSADMALIRMKAAAAAAATARAGGCRLTEAALRQHVARTSRCAEDSDTPPCGPTAATGPPHWEAAVDAPWSQLADAV